MKDLLTNRREYHERLLRENEKYLSKLDALYNEKRGETIVISPWSHDLSPNERAELHLRLLANTYGAGHPGSASTIEALQERQQRNEMLTWICLWNGQPVGMTNIEIGQNGIAELVRSVEIAKGTPLANGDAYNGEANISAAMYKRIPDLVRHEEVIDGVWAIEVDARMAAEITLPTGRRLAPGVRTQHINAQCGMKPYLIHVPRFQVHPEGGHPHQEVFLQSRRYLDASKVNINEALYTPLSHPLNGVLPGEIAAVTYDNAWNTIPVYDETAVETPAETLCTLTHTAAIHFSTIHATGSIEANYLRGAVNEGLRQSRFVEIIIPNRPENILLQQEVMKIGATALGVFPGGTFLTNGSTRAVETTYHFGVLRPDIVPQMVEIGVARDYEGKPMAHVSHRLREEWRKHELQR